MTPPRSPPPPKSPSFIRQLFNLAPQPSLARRRFNESLSLLSSRLSQLDEEIVIFDGRIDNASHPEFSKRLVEPVLLLPELGYVLQGLKYEVEKLEIRLYSLAQEFSELCVRGDFGESFSTTREYRAQCLEMLWGWLQELRDILVVVEVGFREYEQNIRRKMAARRKEVFNRTSIAFAFRMMYM